MAKANRSTTLLAKQVGCSAANISRLRNGDYRPGLRMAFKLQEISDGDVPASAWVEQPSEATS